MCAKDYELYTKTRQIICNNVFLVICKLFFFYAIIKKNFYKSGVFYGT